MPTPDLLRLSLTELNDRLCTRQASPVELMEACLFRIEETRDTLNAVVSMHPPETLLQQAREAEARIARGEARPLEGIPLGVKDLENTAGLPNTHGGSLPFRDNVVDFDDIHVGRVKDAGAIVVGKTNAPEFGFTAITKNLLYSSTHSPWNLLHTPGGSSGGSAAAVAGGVLPLVTASDGGGSIRIPGSFTGLFGLKTSFGRVPIGPISAWSYGDTSVYGPLTKTVEDAALYLDVVAGAHAGDPNSLPHPGYSYQQKLAEPTGKLRIAASPDLGYAVVQSDVARAFNESVKVFEGLGHTIEWIEGGPPQMGDQWLTLGGFWLASALHSYIPEREDQFTYAFMRQVRAGWDMTPELFGAMAARRAELNRWCADLFDSYDLLLTPTVPYDPPPARGPFPSEIEGRRLPPASVASFTIPFNLSWHPASTQRMGLSEKGLPMGLQIVGPRHRDDLVLQASFAFQRERPWHPNWPDI